MRRRVISVFFLAFNGGMPLGDLVAGTLAARFPLSLALLLLALLLASIAGGFLASASGVRAGRSRIFVQEGIYVQSRRD